jgi:predicted  nucleic acid-binding Zn-ribbon protein
LPSAAAEYEDLTNKLRASDERRQSLEKALDPLRQRITEFQLKNRPRVWVWSSTAIC